ncbi:FAD-dependent oxidoreductase [Streptomyces sp. NBC_00670]|jgi:2-polyprenyl-6-methoxyphenol hydroxylase-like FAD-dependent oxidoreductase|uniref:FAD-dependent oxidoreductase n=1 Tax=Streptomyces sp. NBC_00670 TaxID=2975804 RepID=UPI002E362A78|nr:FAD-dependent oxidoreductase [Streptomyces sp. NBC_00670]
MKPAAVTTDVLVVGAGPTGLALGIDLARRGVDALVVEREGTLFPGSRGKGIQPRTMEVFHDLGVVDAIAAVAGDYPAVMMWRDGQRLGKDHLLDPVEPSESMPYNRPWMVPQWRTQEILHARLLELGGTVVFGREVTALTQDDDGVTAAFADGGTVRAQYAVAADGGRSTVRRTLGIGMTGEQVDPYPSMVADVRLTGLDRDNWHMFPPAEKDDPELIAICPLAGTEDFQIMARFAEGVAPDLSLEGVRKVVAARTHLAPEDVTELRWASEFRPRTGLAERFRDGRVFLAGDAAHVHSPAGGQGLNTSVQDAYNLGWKLGAVLREGAPEALLDTYEEERRPNAEHMLGLSTSVHRGETRRGKDTVQLDLHYRESSLSVETRENLPEDALRAGDRAPDAEVDGKRLFDVFRGPQWTPLAVGVDTDVPGAVRISPHGAYTTGLYLVRPDGHVGWAGDATSKDAVREYARRVRRLPV